MTENVVETVSYAQAAREVLRAELEAIGSRVASRPHLLDMYTLLLLTKGRKVSGSDVHDAWAMKALESRPDHHSLIPYEDLAPDKQAKDEKYVLAIIRAHERLNGKKE